MNKFNRQVTDALRRNRRLPRAGFGHREENRGHLVGPGSRSRRVRKATPINSPVKKWVRSVLKSKGKGTSHRLYEDVVGWVEAKGLQL